MFPVAICVATTAMLSGIGGAAMFTPIFLIVFPLLGPEYPFASFAAAIGVSMLTVTFGFLSGFAGYYRAGLIDFKSTWQFIAVGVPTAIVGALMLSALKDLEGPLRVVYALLMLLLGALVLRRSGVESKPSAGANLSETATWAVAERRRIIARTGAIYEYPAPQQGIGAVATAIGAFLTGLLGVGIGEVVVPQLIKRNAVPIPVAAATSVFIVIVVVAAASITLVAVLIGQGGFASIPWNAVVYTIPGVIIGGQIGPRLQGKISRRAMEWAIALLFVAVGIAMAWIAFRPS